MNRKFIQNSNLVLRKILHSEDCLDILKNFIEAFLEIQIKNIQLNYCPIIDGKKSKAYGIVDTRVITKDNEEINVGIQIIDGDYIQNKMFLYYAKVHSNQIFYGDSRKIVRTVTINILDMSYFNSFKYHRVIKVKSNIINDNIVETMELHVIELPKFDKEFDEKFSDKELWTIYIKGNDENTMELVKKQNLQINKLDNLLKKYWEGELIS